MEALPEVQRVLVTQLEKGRGEMRLELGFPGWFSSIPGWRILDVSAQQAHLRIERVTEFGFEARLTEGRRARVTSCSLPARNPANHFWLRYGWDSTRVLFQTWPSEAGEDPPTGLCPCGSPRLFTKCHAPRRGVYIPRAFTDDQVGRRMALVRELSQLVGEAWVKEETSTISARIAANKSGGRTPDPPAHPLAAMFHRVLGKDPPVLNHDLARLSLLARDVQLLSKESILGLEGRLSGLRSTDRDKVHSTIMEIGVGAAAVRAGLDTAFIDEEEEDGEKTPDLLIDGVEVECKKKLPLARRDIRNRDLWGLLKRRASRVFDSWPGNWKLELWTKEDPDRPAIDALVQGLMGMEPPSETVEQEADGLHWVLSPLGDMEGQEGGLVGRVPRHEHPPDFESHEMTALAEGERLSSGKALSFSFSTNQDSDRVKSMVNSLHRAKRQFSAKNPTCIVLEMTPTKRAMRTSDLARLPLRFGEYLAGNTSIGAVLVTYDLWDQEYVRRRQSLAVRNHSASHTVPSGFDLGFMVEGV